MSRSKKKPSNTKTINGHKYEVLPFRAMRNYNMAIKLSATLGMSFKDIGNMFDNGGKAADIGESIYKITSALHINDPEGDLILELFEQTLCDGHAVNEHRFNELYTSNMKEMWEVLFFNIMIHFWDFFPEALSTILQDMLQGNMPSQQVVEN